MESSMAFDLSDGKTMPISDEDESRDEPSDLLPRNPAEDDAANWLALGLGLFVVLVLLIGGWVIIGQMRCNPLFSDAGLAHSRDCR